MQRHVALIADGVLVHSGQTGNDFDLLFVSISNEIVQWQTFAMKIEGFF
jgi:hypothetical protein